MKDDVAAGLPRHLMLKSLATWRGKPAATCATGVPPVPEHGQDGRGTSLVAAPARWAASGESRLPLSCHARIIKLSLKSECVRWHHSLMRMTLSLQDVAVEAIRAYAKRNRLSLGKAASELVRRGAHYQIGIRRVNGLPVFAVPDDFPLITSERVHQLSD